jgi:hypothetical protein
MAKHVGSKKGIDSHGNMHCGIKHKQTHGHYIDKNNKQREKVLSVEVCSSRAQQYIQCVGSKYGNRYFV